MKDGCVRESSLTPNRWFRGLCDLILLLDFLRFPTMKIFRFVLPAVLMFLALPVVMHAQSGCSDSPEAPTDVLMLVGSIGMMYCSSVAMKLLGKSKRR